MSNVPVWSEVRYSQGVDMAKRPAVTTILVYPRQFTRKPPVLRTGNRLLRQLLRNERRRQQHASMVGIIRKLSRSNMAPLRAEKFSNGSVRLSPDWSKVTAAIVTQP